MYLKFATYTLATVLSAGLINYAMADTSSAQTQSNQSLVDEHRDNQEKFSERKQEILKRIDKRRSCVSNAQNLKELKDCKIGEAHHPMGN